MPTVRLEPSGIEFPVSVDEDILTAALRHRVALRYGCRQGKCSSCKQWLVEGDADDSRASVYAMLREERENGAILLCCAQPRTDLVIQIDRAGKEEELPSLEPPAKYTAVVVEQRSLTATLIELRLQLDRPMMFRAGQYTELLLAESGLRRTYSIVNPPSAGAELTFCIKRVPDGMFSGRLSDLAPGAPMQLEGPFGTLFLRETSRPVIAVAIGSGIAPILSMLTDAAERSFDYPIRFYYGAAHADDLVYLNRLSRLQERLTDFQFIPCLSRGDAHGVANGRQGQVARVIAADLRDASNCDAYLCGAPSMCDTVAELLEWKGLPANRIHTDRFYAAAERFPAPAH
ncbi:2Fe-2S iron-sulfur cluster-binding protein [Mycobacterium paragordonae]|jgi:NAD(P)H-flavin reductase/ferredoxin|uniref:2Fe-2S iron-sulfur cluster-binding protein n=1 Tax=Mycobacterium paragordonae TaxID=1389713 RepID=UPI0012E1DE71|nr:2Fe-2S iron-sulfur cluster-binding protein [Mycobacterium paragordonae]